MISISALISTRLKIMTLYWALNFVKQEATHIWRTLTVFPFEPTKSLNNAVILAGYIQVWSNFNMKSAVRVLTSKTSKKILFFNWMPIFSYYYDINILPKGKLAEAERNDITYFIFCPWKGFRTHVSKAVWLFSNSLLLRRHKLKMIFG